MFIEVLCFLFLATSELWLVFWHVAGRKCFQMLNLTPVNPNSIFQTARKQLLSDKQKSSMTIKIRMLHKAFKTIWTYIIREYPMRLIRIDSIKTPCFMIFFFNCHYTFPILDLTCREAMTSASQPFHQTGPAERHPCLPSLVPEKAATQHELHIPSWIK